MKVGIRVMLVIAMLSSFAIAGTSAAGAISIDTPWTIDKTLVANTPGDSTVYEYPSADLQGSRLTYEASTTADGSQVYVYDMRTDEKEMIDDGLEQKRNPQILGTGLLFAGFDGDDWGVWSHELGDDASSLVTETAQPADISVDDAGNYAFSASLHPLIRSAASVDETIAADDYAPDTFIYAGTMSDPHDIERINDHDALQIMPKVSGDYLAYFEYQDTIDGNDFFKLMVQSLENPALHYVVEDYIMPGALAVGGDLIAWTQWDEDADMFILKAYNASTDDYFTPIPAVEGSASNPLISGTQIYWSTHDPLYATNVWDTQLERSILAPVGSKLMPLAILDNCYVWAANTGNTSSRLGVSYLDVPFVWLECYPEVKYGYMPFLDGQVVDNNYEVGGGRVLLQESDDGQLWTTVNDDLCDADGYFMFSAPKLTTNAYYRAVYVGKLSQINGEDVFNLSAASTTRWCVAQASVGAPSAPKTVRYNKQFTSTGNISPSQTNQQAAGRIEAYFLQNGQWVRKGTFGAYFDGGKYSANVKLWKKGKWILRMNFLGSNSNAPVKGNWTNVTVN